MSFTPKDRRRSRNRAAFRDSLKRFAPWAGLVLFAVALGYVGTSDYESLYPTGEVDQRPAELMRATCGYSATVYSGDWERICGEMQDLSKTDY